ncbi:MAG TPA: hypothetical protein VK211_28520 [Kamptonema sp.]|nr:hypothetical protein [Kamptonema sp.]
MALWAKNKGNFSVAFTEDAADQTLLAAIEKELVLTKYQTFSNLCKQALWQFLSVSESAQPTPSFQRLEQRIVELQLKFAEFELNVTAEEISRLEGLESHLTQLSEQLEQLQASVNTKFAQVSMAVEPKRVEPEPEQHLAPQQNAEVEASRREPDPLLDRLSSLLPQDF